jgi:hypothetical protein
VGALLGDKLPADQALQVVPRDDQIIVGAVALGLFTVLGVIAVAGVYASDSAGRPTDGMRVALALLITVEVATAILLANEDVLTKVIALVVTVLLGVAAMVMTYFPMAGNGALAVNFLTRRRDWLWEHIPFTNLSADAVTTRALPVFPTDDEVAEAKRRHQLFLEECETPALSYRRGLKCPAFAVAGVTTVAVSVAFLLLFGDDGFVGLGVAVAAVLAGISFGVAWGSGPRFWPYGLAVFFSVLEDANKRASALFEELVARQPPGGAPTEDGERPPGALEVPSPPPTPAVVVPCS